MRILKSFCIVCVKGYRLTLAPLFMSLGVRCRFTPSCSEYALQSFELHGLGRALCLTAWRLARCHPFCMGGCDPVPQMMNGDSAKSAAQLEISHG